MAEDTTAEPEAPRRRLLTTAQAAPLLMRQKSTLDHWRLEPNLGPPWFKIGSRVYYAEADLEQWLEAQRVDPAEAGR